MPVLPSSLMRLLSLLRPAFTAPTFQTFEALVAGMIGRVGEHTVCGMWQAARLADRVHHSVGHDFFARSRWSTDEVGLRLLDFLIARFVDPGAAVSLAVDGSVFVRSGPKVHGARWHHDASAARGGGLKYGNCFVVVGLVVRIGVSSALTRSRVIPCERLFLGDHDACWHATGAAEGALEGPGITRRAAAGS